MQESLKGLWKWLGPWQGKYLIASVLLVVSTAVLALEPKVLQLVVDHYLPVLMRQSAPTNQDPILGWMLKVMPDPHSISVGAVMLGAGLLYLAIATLRGGLVLAASALNADSTESAAKALRDRLFAHLQQVPMSFYTVFSKGEVIQRCTGDIDTVRNFAQAQIVEIVRMAAIFLFAFFLLLMIHVPFAFLSIAVVLLTGTGGFWFFGVERRVWEAHETEADKLSKMVQENITGIRTVAAFANQAYEKARFDHQNREKLRVGVRHVLAHTGYWPVADLLVLLQIVISMLFGGHLVMQGELTVGELLTAYTYLMLVSWPMRQLGRMLSQAGMASVAMERIDKILEANPEDYAAGDRLPALRGEIEFREVYFRYSPDSEVFALENVSFRIEAGEKVALVGPTGAGKTSVVNLLLRLYEPERGQILLDGRDLREYAKPDLRKLIGVVLQKPFLFSATVKDNITYAHPQASPADVVESVSISQIESLHDTLPEGLETVVGEKGVTLSGGQKQRVALARTLLSVPSILVLDDITSAVDTETEQAIFQALDEKMGRQTTLLISHRVSTILRADRVLAFDKGRLVQVGTPAELAAQPGYFQQISEVQNSVWLS